MMERWGEGEDVGHWRWKNDLFLFLVVDCDCDWNCDWNCDCDGDCDCFVPERRRRTND